MSRFKNFVEAANIFGFEPEIADDKPFDHSLVQPIHKFDIELMMELLGNKSIGGTLPYSPFINEIRWGTVPGAIKLEVDTGCTFFIKKLAVDREGTPRWVTKKAFQLNRNGYGGMEDVVSQEIYEHISKLSKTGIDSPLEEYNDIEDLVRHIYGKIKHVGKNIFIPEGCRKLGEHAYLINFGVRGQGIEARNHQRVEQNQTMVSYDPERGTIRITNYNVVSKNGRDHEFKISPSDLDLYFLPSQSPDEISETIAVHMKYY